MRDESLKLITEHVGNEMDPSPLCHDEIAQHQTGIEERGSTYEQV